MGKRRKSKQSPSSKAKQPESKFDSRLATIILAKGLVTSPEESICLAEAIVAEIEESELSREQACIVSFEDYFSLSREEATNILSRLLELEPKDADKSDDDSSLAAERTESRDDDEFGLSDDDGEFIGEGECVLCERYIRLTKHHLIPRSTWPKIQPRLTNAARALSKNDVHRAGLILGPGLHHMLEPLARTEEVDKTDIKGLLQLTTNICSPCHSAVHRAHVNIELANNYSTIGLLLKDEHIFKFAKWASKQRTGKHAV
jgi:hypothetical protein